MIPWPKAGPPPLTGSGVDRPFYAAMRFRSLTVKLAEREMNRMMTRALVYQTFNRVREAVVAKQRLKLLRGEQRLKLLTILPKHIAREFCLARIIAACLPLRW